MNIELVESGNTESMPFIPQKRSREFETLYKSLIVNYNSLNRDNIEYQRPSFLYVFHKKPSLNEGLGLNFIWVT